jgi:hypothetical protein
MFELRYDVQYSDEKYEYYDIYKDGKPCYKDKESNIVLSFEVDRYKKTIQFINISDEIINELFFDRYELYLLILSLYDELDIEGYRVLCEDLLSNGFKHALEEAMIEKRN